MKHLLAVLCACACVLIVSSPTNAWAAANGEKPKLIVLDLAAAGGVEPSVAGALSETVANETQARGFFQVLSSREVATLIGLERQRELLGCSDDSSACLTELS